MSQREIVCRSHLKFYESLSNTNQACRCRVVPEQPSSQMEGFFLIHVKVKELSESTKLIFQSQIKNKFIIINLTCYKFKLYIKVKLSESTKLIFEAFVFYTVVTFMRRVFR